MCTLFSKCIKTTNLRLFLFSSLLLQITTRFPEVLKMFTDINAQSGDTQGAKARDAQGVLLKSGPGIVQLVQNFHQRGTHSI